MSTRDMLLFAVGLAGLCAICALCFVVWLLWSLFWDVYDHLTGRWKRIESTRIDSNYNRGQFSVPDSQRDFK